MPLRIVTEPTVDIVTVSEMKNFLKIDDVSTDEDDYINLCITSAREWVEQYTKWGVIEVQREYIVDLTNKYFIELPRPPLKSIDSVYVTDYTGVESVVSASNYKLDKSIEPNLLYFSGAAGESARVLYTSGYTSEALPGNIKLAVMTLAGARYDSRTSAEIPPAVNQLLSGYRILGHMYHGRAYRY